MTAKGNPSGMATTIIETHNINILKILLNPSEKDILFVVKYSTISWMTNATKVTIAEPKPKYPIRSAIEFNFISKGVLLSSCALSIVPRIIPF